MDTTPLKSFATSARTELIREVSARITAVLSQGAPERVEQPKTVTALERAIAGGGGGDKGKAHVADKVAYTWFNRIIALRFMDANGYTGIGVVSPAADQVGQPEVLAAAKRGQVDTEVVYKGTDAVTITGLLNGTRQPRPGADAQAEAYALLLADYCRFWNRAMPFMFEREGDYTELLIPANLLADDSVLSRSVAVLSEDVCQDVEVIGWLYQFYIEDRKDEVFAGFKKNKRAGADEIPAATQLFTPHWIVRYLVENSLGRLWMLNRPNSGLVSKMDYYIAPVDVEAQFLKIAKPEELKIIDPACGSGHMLTYAFDLLYAIYEEEGYAPSEIPGQILAHNLYGTEIDPRAGALAAFALTMKAAAKRKLFLKNPVEPNVCVIEPISFGLEGLDFLLTPGGDRHEERSFWNQFAEADMFGSLIRPSFDLSSRLSHHLAALDHGGDILNAETIERAQRVMSQTDYLTRTHAVVVTNPPYMGSGNMSASLSEWIKGAYPKEKQDLYACFVVRSDEFVAPLGYVAMVTGDTWMTIKSFEKLRHGLLRSHAFLSFVHMRDVSNHPDIFGANTAFVIGKDEDPSTAGMYVFLDAASSDTKDQHLREAVRGQAPERCFVADASQFAEIPGSPIVFRLPGSLRAAFSKGKPLAALSSPRNGLQTSDNGRFLRLWWETASGRTALPLSSDASRHTNARWFPYNKGGEYRRWYGNQTHVVNWENGGAEVRQSLDERYPYLNGNLGALVRATDDYFKPHVSWSAVSSGAPAFREYPEGLIFDAAANSLFPVSESERRMIAGILNSSVTTALLAALAPTLNFVVGDIAKLPIVIPNRVSELTETVSQLVDAAREDWDAYETSWNFSTESWPIQPGRLGDLLAAASARWAVASRDQQAREGRVNRIVAEAYGLEDEVPIEVPLHRVSLTRNVEFRYGPGKSSEEYVILERADLASELVSLAVGCMFGRFSLDLPGLVLADEGGSISDYQLKFADAGVAVGAFTPDDDGVIPIVDGDWFEDDVVGRFRQFLRTAFGDQHFEENLKFVTESLGVKNLRDYFITKAGKSKFYDDHVQRYKKRPIYWLFSSPKGSFNALVYMHRYTPSTVSTVLTYLREYVTKLESSLQQAERAGNAKEADRLRKILVELNEYEHDTLYPKASENVAIDLDDGVKTNYPKFGAALKKIAGLEASGE